MSLSTLLSLQFSLGNKPWQPCYVARMDGITVMMDCALDLSVLLNFLPLPLVYRCIPPDTPTNHTHSLACCIVCGCVRTNFSMWLFVLLKCSPKLSSLSLWKPRSKEEEPRVDEDVIRLVCESHDMQVTLLRFLSHDHEVALCDCGKVWLV